MNQVDFDKSVCDKDGRGNVTAKNQNGISADTFYKDYRLDIGIGSVKVWTLEDKFFGRFQTVQDAKISIDNAEC